MTCRLIERYNEARTIITVETGKVLHMYLRQTFIVSILTNFDFNDDECSSSDMPHVVFYCR